MAIFLKRTALAVLLAVAVIVVAAFLLLRASLPNIQGELIVEGIDSAVSIERDSQGIPVIRAATREALAFGTGFAHAQDRFFQMDLLRRQAAGELSALVGRAALDVDRRHRLHRFRHRAGLALARMPAVEKVVLSAYVHGVNAGLESLGSRPFEYWLLGVRPEPWRAEDSVLVGYSMFLELNDASASRDVRRGIAKLALPAALFDFLFPAGTSWDAPVTGDPLTAGVIPDIPWPVLQAAGTAAARIVVNENLPEPALLGSNNWAVAGSLTESGRAIVANDMHLGIAAPNVWYRARLLQSGGEPRDVSGVSLPGTPVIVAGSNGKVAWAFTNSNGDWTDAVLLRPGASADSYLTADGERAIVTHTETIEIKDSDPEVLEVRETQWGPIRPDADYPAGEIAISWIAHHAEAVNFAHLQLETVRNVDEALDAANAMGIPPQNFVTGDSGGSIGWTIAGRIPKRGAAAATFPGDWSAGEGWQGWVDRHEYPRIVNPVDGRIWTANARVVDGDGLKVLGDGGYDLGARAGQIRDSLYSRERYAEEDMLEIHLDDRALFLERWRGLLLDVLDEAALRDSPDRSLYRELVEAWVPRATSDSVGYRLLRAFRSTVSERVFHELVAAPAIERFGDGIPLRRSNQFEGPLWQILTERPGHLLPAGVASWEALMIESVDQIIDHLHSNFEGGLEQRTWGERNTAAIRHPLSPALPFLSFVLDMPRDQLPGDSHLPRVQGPTVGASERFAVAPGAEGEGYLHMPAGQSGHPLSDHYRDGHAAWVDGLATPFLPGEARHTLRLVPAGS